MRSGECRSCGAEITWAKHHRTGTLMPMEEADDGDWILRETGDGVLTVYDPDGLLAEEGEQRHRSHFATCPDAKEWRKQR